VPIVALVLSEGGSGGALALGLADRVYMLENAVYSILSPEGFASILWKDETRAQEAAELMESTAQDLFKKGLIDGIVDEAPEGLHTDLNRSTVAMKELLRNDLNELCALKPERLLQQRYVKFRKMGATL